LDDNGIGGYISYTSFLMMEGDIRFNKNKFKYEEEYVSSVCVGVVDYDNDNENDGCSKDETKKKRVTEG